MSIEVEESRTEERDEKVEPPEPFVLGMPLKNIYEAALTATPDFVYVFDLSHRFIYANKALLDMWGRSKEEAIGRTLIELGYEPWHAEMHDKEIDQVIITKKRIKGEVPFTGTRGRRIYEYIFSPILSEEGEITAIAGTTRDITKRKEMEEALKKSEERSRAALDAFEFIGTWNWDLKTNLIVADERFARFHFVDPEIASKGGPVEDYLVIIHPEDVARMMTSIQCITLKGGDYSEEYRLLPPDGSVQWVIARGRASLDVDGNPLRFTGAAVDITERKLAEEQLKQREQELRMMTDVVPQQIWTARSDGELDYVNAYTKNYVGDIAIKDGIVDWIEFIHPEDRPHSTRIWAYCVHTGAPFEIQQRIFHKDSGQYRWNLSRAVPARNESNQIIKWFGTNTDIQDQKQSEEAIKEAREYLALMVESAQDYAIISINTQGIIISWNSGAEQVFGYLSEEIIGQPFFILFTKEDQRNDIPAHEIKTATQKGRCKDERWHLRKNNTKFYASGIMAAMHDDRGDIKGYIKITRDITKEKEAQEALLAARNAAEVASIAKTEFLANMSHEIRTPMNAVIGLSNILAISQPLTVKQKEFIDTLQTSADALLKLINDLLDIAKIEARTVDIEHVPFSIVRLVNQVIRMMAVKTQEKGLVFNFQQDCACADKRMFIGDPARLRQILLNLCSNAIKFTEKGSIQVTVTCQETEHPEKEMVHLAVTDTGIGIAPEKIDTIFEKFVQADSSINRKYGGTGLGLTITKTLVEIMGGTIEVESILGKGSTFKLSLPFKVERSEKISEFEVAAGNNAIAENEKPSVLLVEDYPANVMVATTFLEAFGYGYDVASNGMDAIEKIKTGHFSAVLMDVQMHGMNGFEATRHIREYEKQHGLSRIPIIGMTAHALLGDRERCLAASMDDYLAKPFNPDKLFEILQRVVNRV